MIGKIISYLKFSKWSGIAYRWSGIVNTTVPKTIAFSKIGEGSIARVDLVEEMKRIPF